MPYGRYLIDDVPPGPAMPEPVMPPEVIPEDTIRRPASREATKPNYSELNDSLRKGVLDIPPYVRALMDRYEVKWQVIDAPSFATKAADVPDAAGEFDAYAETPTITLAGDSNEGPFSFSSLPAGALYEGKSVRGTRLSGTPSHEAAHFTSWFVEAITGHYQSDMPLLRRLYDRFCKYDPTDERSRGRPVPYACRNPEEFLAEIMMAFWSSSPFWKARFRTDAPELYNYAAYFDNKLRALGRHFAMPNAETYGLASGSMLADPFRPKRPSVYYTPPRRRPEAMGSLDTVSKAKSAWEHIHPELEPSKNSGLDVLKAMDRLGIPIHPTLAWQWANPSGKFEELVGEDDLLLPIKPGSTREDAMFVYAIRDALRSGDLNEAHRLYFSDWPGSDSYMDLPR